MTLKKQHFALSTVAKPTKVPEGYKGLLDHFRNMFYEYLINDQDNSYNLTVTNFEDMSYSYRAKYMNEPVDKIVSVFFKASFAYGEGRFLYNWFHNHYYDLDTVNKTVSKALNGGFLIPIGEAKNIEFEIENPELPDRTEYNIRITFDLYKDEVTTTTQKPVETTTTAKPVETTKKPEETTTTTAKTTPTPQNVTVTPTPDGGNIAYD